jgi:flavodoxin I
MSFTEYLVFLAVDLSKIRHFNEQTYKKLRYMGKIGIFYGSTTGNTEKVAEMIQKVFGEQIADIYNVDTAGKEDIEKYTFLIFGVSTWGVSDLQDDFEDFLDILETVDFKGKKVALYGLGDQSTYAETFVDAMGVFYKWLIAKRVNVIGLIEKTGYSFTGSMAMVKGKLAGLAIDEEFESDLTSDRVAQWVALLKKEFDL